MLTAFFLILIILPKRKRYRLSRAGTKIDIVCRMNNLLYTMIKVNVYM